MMNWPLVGRWNRPAAERRDGSTSTHSSYPTASSSERPGCGSERSRRTTHRRVLRGAKDGLVVCVVKGGGGPSTAARQGLPTIQAPDDHSTATKAWRGFEPCRSPRGRSWGASGEAQVRTYCSGDGES